MYEILPDNIIQKDAAISWLTPTVEEQVIRIIKGLCPHNAGWQYEGHSHNDSAYKCVLCGIIAYY